MSFSFYNSKFYYNVNNGWHDPSKQFYEYSLYPDNYPKPEPERWVPKVGEEKTFSLFGQTIVVPKELDLCIKYRRDFFNVAHYYREKAYYKYSSFINDYDSFVYYFQNIFFEGYTPLIDRVCSLFLLFGIFDISPEAFGEIHLNTYSEALSYYIEFAKVEVEQKSRGVAAGNDLSNSMTFYGGGFGLRGAMKGIAQAEILNLGMSMLGQHVANRMKLTQSQKSEVYSAINTDDIMYCTYSDYANTFYSFVQILIERRIISNIQTIADSSFDVMLNNIDNPMFPKEKIPSLLVELIKKYPFEDRIYSTASKKYGMSLELEKIQRYFLFGDE